MAQQLIGVRRQEKKLVKEEVVSESLMRGRNCRRKWQ